MSTVYRQFGDERTRRFALYLLVGLGGLTVNQGVLYASTAILGFQYVIGGALGRILSVLFNYVVNDRWTWANQGERGLRNTVIRGGKYVAASAAGMVMGLATLIVLVEFAGMHYLVANLFAIGLGVLWGFGSSELWVWGTEPPSRSTLTKVKDELRSRIESVSRHTWIVLGLSTALFVGFSIYTVALYNSYWSTGADLGAYVHMFQTTLEGTGFLQQGKYRMNHPGGSYWGAHFSLTVLVFLIPYALYPDPVTLLITKSFVIAAGVPVLWLVAREQIERDHLALLLTISYALNPFLWTAAIYDFQEQILLPLFIFGAYYAYSKHRYTAFLALSALALLTNEFVIFVYGGFLVGLAVASYRSGKMDDEWSVFLGAGALLVGAKLLASAVMARFSEFGGIPTDLVAEPITAAIIGSGGDPVRIPLNAIIMAVATDPFLALNSLAIRFPIKVLFLALLLLPVLFLPLTDEPALGALIPYIGLAWVLTNNPAYYQYAAHYSLYILPFIYIAGARKLGWVSDVVSSKRVARVTTNVVGISIMVTLVGGLLVSGMGYKMVPQQNQHTETLDAAIDTIPEDATLVTQNTIYPHVATRSGATFVMDDEYFERYQERHGAIQPEYILIDSNLDTRPKDWSEPVFKSYSDQFGDEYRLYRYEDGIFVFKRGYDGEPKGITTDSYEVDTRQYKPSTTVPLEDQIDSETIVNGNSPSEGVVWKGPWTAGSATLPPGTYEVTFHIKVTDTGINGEPGSGHAAYPPKSSETEERAVGIFTDDGTVVMKPVGETDGYEDVTTEFTLDKTSIVRFQRIDPTQSSIKIKYVEISETDSS